MEEFTSSNQPRIKPNDASSLDLSMYANCWVAVVNGRVTGVGRTAHEALLASRYQRLKDEPALIWVPPPEAKV